MYWSVYLVLLSTFQQMWISTSCWDFVSPCPKKKKGDKLCLADYDLPYVNRGSLTFGPTQRRVRGRR